MTEKQKKWLDTIAQQVARANDPKLSASTPKEELPLGVEDIANWIKRQPVIEQ